MNESEEFESLEVIIPSGVSEGDAINVQTDDGRMFEVIVPKNAKVGEKLVVMIAKTAQGGASVIGEVHHKPPSSNAVALGAGATGAVIGTLLLGPVVGVVAAGAAIYATTREDKLGEAARSTGSFACNTYEKTVEVANKYQVGEKLKVAGEATTKKLAEIDQEFKVSDNAVKAAQCLWRSAVEFDNKYKITSQASDAVVKGVSMAAREVGTIANSTPSPASNHGKS